MTRAEIEAELTRLRSDAVKYKNEADGKKVSINGIFGKLGSAYSAVFAPDLMLQVTLSGQLCLLMLIERIEMTGINVISGNTDGFVTRVPRARYDEFLRIVQEWEALTGFETEETRYRGLYSRDVNSFIAVKEDGKTKGKGAYANPWRGGKPDWRGQMSLTPSSSICVEAVEERLVHGTPVDVTIRGCRDLTKFVNVRTVKGGALYADEYLGKAVRWYYGHSSEGPIVYRLNGNKVAGSDGAVPCMDLPDTFPNDVDYDAYIRMADEMLVDLGAVRGFETPKISKINKSHPYQLFLAGVVSEIRKSNSRRK